MLWVSCVSCVCVWVSESYVWVSCVRESCVSEEVVCVRDGGGRRQEEAGGADGSAQPKTRTPHKDVQTKPNMARSLSLSLSLEFSEVCLIDLKASAQRNIAKFFPLPGHRLQPFRPEHRWSSLSAVKNTSLVPQRPQRPGGKVCPPHLPLETSAPMTRAVQKVLPPQLRKPADYQTFGRQTDVGVPQKEDSKKNHCGYPEKPWKLDGLRPRVSQKPMSWNMLLENDVPKRSGIDLKGANYRSLHFIFKNHGFETFPKLNPFCSHPQFSLKS